MAKIVFWSPDTNMTGLTHTVIATATLMGIMHKASSILLQSNKSSRKMESAYTPYEELKSSGAFENSDLGVGALTKIIVSNKLTPTAIKNYAKPVLKERLDILYGIISRQPEQYEMVINNLPLIINKAAEAYDIVFIDLPKGTNSKAVKDVLEDADVVVCVVNQDIVKLDEFFGIVAKEKSLKDKKKIIVMGNYHGNSKYNIRNIKNKFRVKEEIYSVPNNTYFEDACNDGLVIDYLYKNINAERNDYNGEFISEVSKIVEKIVELTGIKDI